MKHRVAVLLVLAAALAGCKEHRATPREYLAVVPEIVRFMEQDAREHAYGRGARGPLLADLESFRGNAFRATGEVLDSAAVQAAIGPEVRDLQPDSALLCQESEFAAGCWVREYGVYLHLNLITPSPGQLRAFASSEVTDPRYIPSVVCKRVWELTFTQPDTAAPYRLTDRELTHDCPGG